MVGIKSQLQYRNIETIFKRTVDMIKQNFFQLATFLLVVVFGSCYAKKMTYSGFALYRCLPQTSFQVDQLRSLMNEKKQDGIEFWTEPRGLNESVDIMISPEEHEFLCNQLRILRIPAKKIMHDVGEVIKKTSTTSHPHKTYSSYREATNISLQASQKKILDSKVFYSKYQSYSMILLKLNDLAKDPRVTLELAGLSYEKRKIYVVKVSTNPDAKKPVVFIDAGHHAREWISHTTILYIMESLVNENMPKQSFFEANNNFINTSSQLYNNLKSKLEKYDFWFVPVVNPDGYEYTHTTNRLWRKTRSRNLICYGVDPNRNYPFHWRESGASSVSCDETYAGSRPLSEPETEIIANILDKNQKRIIMYISLHAYSQLMLVPWGWGRVYPDNYNEMKRVAVAGMNEIASVRGTIYSFGTSSIVLYPAAGGSDDYAYGHTNIKLSYTIELPDTGDHGFLMPPKEIIPVGQETTAGLTAMVGAIEDFS